ncbi:MAG: biotin transporter BioY [Lachnospiraceae bacterium]|nr:biotin transporter BioY [Lachnospiraceae bacterium]
METKTGSKTRSKTQAMTFIALCTAMTCILAPLSISIPISPVPISLTIFAILISAYVLGLKNCIFSFLLYALIGFIGVPVFSKFTGGPGVLLGPTGGYIIGFIFVAFFAGLFIEKFENARYMHAIGMIIGVAVCYVFGTAWLAQQAGMGFRQALYAGVIPFIPADAVKIAAAIAIGPRLRRISS